MNKHSNINKNEENKQQARKWIGSSNTALHKEQEAAKIKQASQIEDDNTLQSQNCIHL